MKKGSPYFRICLRLKRLLCAFLILFIQAPYAVFYVEAATRETVKNKVEPLVAVLVEAELAGSSLRSHIDRYIEDVRESLPAHVVSVSIPKDASPLEIYEGLKHFYLSGVESDEKTQLQGVVLVGDVPLPVIDKDGVLYPSVFPYIDLEDEVYQWDQAENRFVYREGHFMKPEIWHGVIKSALPALKDQVKELEAYFVENHKVHSEDRTYSPRVFLADLEAQRKVIPEEFAKQYRTWIEHADDIVYHRWSAELLEDLFPEWSK
ncbi:MAG TPA: hypothetical protein VIT68_01430, partial [Candidatus Gracilibacteria bacterium]